MTAREYAALDNYITGHYGEDQYPPDDEYDPADNIPEEVSPCEEVNCEKCIDLHCKHNKYDGEIFLDGPPGFSDYPLQCRGNCYKPDE
jgi:hypothetical protein